MAKPAVFGIVENEYQARTAVRNLEQAGFLTADISVLSQNREQELNVDRGPLETVDGEKISARTRNVGHANSTKAPEGATAGAAAGGAVGALAGWLISIGALAIPGMGPFIAAGPIMAALSAAAVGAAAGGVGGALVGCGIPEYEANIYAGKLDVGHILIGVHTVNSDEASAARKALDHANAHDIHVTSEVPLKG